MKQHSILAAVALALVGCAANNHTNPPAYYTPPTPAPVVIQEAPKPTRAYEYPCGNELDVHVGKGEVVLPKGLKVAVGSEGSLDLGEYTLHIEDATFHTRTFCQKQE